jgi:outer membrane biosynthesis protein TonB
MDGQQERAAYVVPSYRAPVDAAWYHFLHGNVPGHQIDFIYRAEVPQGPLTRQHFSHLSRLMKYIEPQSNERFAFAIGNLSRDDTQYEPGHGGLALIFGLRIRGATDHAGRQDPPFAHAVAAIDRALDYSTLVESAVAFHRHVAGAAESAEWYRAYVHGAQEDPGRVLGVLESYVARFADLPQPGESGMGGAWVTGGAAQPRRIVIAHDEETTFGEVAAIASRIAAILYRSDIRWTVISNGREDDVPNGVSIRVLSRAELGPADAAATVHDISALPEDDVELASLLFGASPVTTEVKKPRGGWRDRYSEAEPPPPPVRSRVRRGAGEDEISVDIEIDPRRSSNEPPVRRSAPGAQPVATLEELAPTLQAPLRPAPASIRPQPASEPPAGDRAAIFEAPIPPPPRLPEPEPAKPVPPPVVKPQVLPDPAPASVKSSTARAIALPRAQIPPEPARPRWLLWVVVGSLVFAAIAVVVLLTGQGGSPTDAPGSPSTSVTGPAPSLPTTQTTATATATATTTATATATATTQPSQRPSVTTVPTPKRPHRPAKPTSTAVLGGSLDQ